MTPFFFIGCRRTGTTAMRRMLNVHPNIYCSFESAVMFILKNIHDGGDLKSAKNSVKNWSHTGQTFKYARCVFADYSESDRSLEGARKAFFRAIDLCKKGRFPYDGDTRGDFLAIGEKNPSEYSEPDVNKFILSVHPDAKFIHPVRHPYGFARSSGFRGEIQHRDEITPGLRDPYALWETNEMNALAAEERAPTFRFRYEDLCSDPVLWVKKLYDFLVPETSEDDIRYGSRLVGVNGNLKYGELSIPDGYSDLRRIASLYGYE